MMSSSVHSGTTFHPDIIDRQVVYYNDEQRARCGTVRRVIGAFMYIEDDETGEMSWRGTKELLP